MTMPAYINGQKNLEHEFDPDLDRNSEILLLARTAASIMDHECISDTPVKAKWRSVRNSDYHNPQYKPEETVALELHDSKLGIEQVEFFTKRDVLGVYGSYQLLHNWNRFQRLQLNRLIRNTFAHSAAAEGQDQ